MDPYDWRGTLVYIGTMVDLALKNELFYLGEWNSPLSTLLSLLSPLSSLCVLCSITLFSVMLRCVVLCPPAACSSR